MNHGLNTISIWILFGRTLMPDKIYWWGSFLKIIMIDGIKRIFILYLILLELLVKLMIFGHYPPQKVRWFINTFFSFQKPLWILKEWKKFMSENLSFL